MVVAHPAVEDCNVIGVPDATWGEEVAAVVQIKAGGEIDLAELQAFCGERFGGIKAPKQFDVWQELPRSPAGKLLCRRVREVYLADRESGSQHRMAIREARLRFAVRVGAGGQGCQAECQKQCALGKGSTGAGKRGGERNPV
ncbi:MAG: hypothetical protein FWD68_14975 [Alphaproteobacteria bacterium]|nr:hypothetical protein [Alphaproteobacteria bacterium]